MRKLAIHFPQAGMVVGRAIDTWIARAVLHRKEELENLPSGDWLAFDQTAPGRLALCEIGVVGYAIVTREELARFEEEWVNDSVEALIEYHTTTSEGSDRVRSDVWRAIEKDILALKSLDEDESRFKAARRRLFDLAYASALVETGRLIKAGRYNAAFGVLHANTRSSGNADRHHPGHARREEIGRTSREVRRTRQTGGGGSRTRGRRQHRSAAPSEARKVAHAPRESGGRTLVMSRAVRLRVM